MAGQNAGPQLSTSPFEAAAAVPRGPAPEERGIFPGLEDLTQASEVFKPLTDPQARARAEPVEGTVPMQVPSGETRQRPVTTHRIAWREAEPHQAALLNVIAGPESGGRYDVRFDGTPTGATFTSFDEHPRIFEPIPAGFQAAGQRSSAAGRYQFTATTWDDTGGGRFTPEEQDKRAWRVASDAYRQRTGRTLDTDLRERGLTADMVRALAPIWEGLSGMPIMDAVRTYNDSLHLLNERQTRDSLQGLDRTQGLHTLFEMGHGQ